MTRAAPLAALLLAAALAAPARAGDPPDPKGELVKTVRVLVQNIYGRNEDDCAARYTALAAHILAASPPYDVVALNEHWKKLSVDKWMTCDDAVLTKALEKDAAFAAKDHSVKHLPTSTDVYELGGGNSVFSRHPLTDAYEAKFVNGQPIPLSGYVMTRVQVAPGVEFDLWTVHLEAGSDGCDDDCRWEQATDLGSAVELFSGTPDKGQKGRPVLIVGDLNTGGPMSAAERPPFAGNGGYENVVVDALRKPRDLWLELDGGAAGYTYDCASNSIPKCKYRERIDYMLLPEDKRIVHPSAEFYFAPKAIDVVRWKTPAGGNISDHFGLDATLEIRRRPAAAKPPRSRTKAVTVGAPPRWD